MTLCKLNDILLKCHSILGCVNISDSYVSHIVIFTKIKYCLNSNCWPLWYRPVMDRSCTASNKSILWQPLLQIVNSFKKSASKIIIVFSVIFVIWPFFPQIRNNCTQITCIAKKNQCYTFTITISRTCGWNSMKQTFEIDVTWMSKSTL